MRLEWPHLPPHVRALVERRIGGEVVDAETQDFGFSNGFASVLTRADGSRHFVKGASVRAQRAAASSYRAEAMVLPALPEGVPSPLMCWQHDDDEWVLLGLEYVDGEAPARPWRAGELDRCLDALEQLAEAGAEGLDGLDLTTFAEDFEDGPAAWDVVRGRGALVAREAHLAEAADLATGFAEATAGGHLVHTDLRDDNFLLTSDGAQVLDWSWPALGAPWVDTVLLLVGPRADGLDVEALLAERRLTRGVPAERVDALLALVAGVQLRSAGDRPPPASPYLRDHQRILGEAAWDWLAERRGWH
jgi:aminoglycoside phosphotransferase (APT) family kinase protein